MPGGDATTASPSTRGYERTNGWVGRSSAASPRSLEITAPVAEWEHWTGMWFPEAGRYVFAGGLAPLEVSDGTGTYFEPNVWMIHGV